MLQKIIPGTIKYFALIFIFCLCSFFSFAQKNKVDSLNKILQTTTQDSARLRLYGELGLACSLEDNLKYGQAGLDLANKLLEKTTDRKEQIKYLKQKAEACEYICYYYSDKRDLKKMFEYKQTCLSIYINVKDTAKISAALINYFDFYSREGNIPKALEYCRQGLDIFKEMNYKSGEAYFLMLLGNMYSNAGINDLALENYNKSLVIAIGIKNINIIAQVNVSLGNMYNKANDIEQSLAAYNKAVMLFKQSGNQIGLLTVYTAMAQMYAFNNKFYEALDNYQKALSITANIKIPVQENMRQAAILAEMGSIYTKQENFTQALKCQLEALSVAEKEYEKINLALVYGKLAETYTLQKNFKQAKFYSDNSLAIYKKNKIIPYTRDAEKLAAKVDSSAGNFKDAYTHYQQYIILYNLIKSEEVNKAATRDKYQNDYDNQKAIDKAAQEKKDLVAKNEIEQQKIVRNSFIGGFIFVLILVIIVFRNYRQKQLSNQELALKNKEIEDKNKDILDSIRYAKRIQSSLLPTEKYISRILNKKNKEQ